MPDPNDERGPREEAPPNVVSTDLHSVPQATAVMSEPRCLMCGHPISCEESIRAGVGRDCRRRIRRLALAMTA